MAASKQRSTPDVQRPDARAPAQTQHEAEPITSLPPGALRAAPALDRPLNQGQAVAHLRGLQHSVGNSAVVRRFGPDAGTTTTTADPAAAAVPDDLQSFRDHGPFPAGGVPGTITPRTGLGGFDATYDPSSMELTVTVNMLMTFLDGITMSGGVFIGNNPGLQRLVDALNATTGERRARAEAAVQDGWQWHGDEDAWMAQYQQQVAAAWSGHHVFQGTRPGWEGQLANVRVQINAAKIVQSGGEEPVPEGAAGGPVHTRATIFKTSPVERAADALTPIPGNIDESMPLFGGRDVDVGAEVDPGAADDPADQELTLGSDQLITDVQKLTHQVFFDFDKDELRPDDQDRLRMLIRTIQAPAGQPGTSIEVVGHASTEGDPTYNQGLSQRRANRVAEFLRSEVVDGAALANVTTRLAPPTGAGETGMDASERSRRVDVVVAGGPRQNVAAHEFGHMIGLGDEYAVPRDATTGDPNGLVRGTGPQVGGATAHDTLATELGLGGAVAENNDSVMSLGNSVRPQHYVTFLQALGDVTGVTDWRVRS